MSQAILKIILLIYNNCFESALELIDEYNKSIGDSNWFDKYYIYNFTNKKI